MKAKRRIGEKLIYAIIAVVGVSFIMLSNQVANWVVFILTSISNYSGNISDVEPILSDLGIGLFPTGAIGIIISIMQTQSDIRELKEKRRLVLQNFGNQSRNFLSSLLYDNKEYIEENGCVDKQLEIISNKQSNATMNRVTENQIQLSENKKQKLIDLQTAIENLVQLEYSSDLFSVKEYELLKELSASVNNYYNSDNERNQIERLLTTIRIMKLCLSKIPEVKYLLTLRYNGSAIE